MAFADKSAENKRIAAKCMEMKAYNAGVTRAYYSAFQHIKAYLTEKKFDYEAYLRQVGSTEREFSHGTLQAAITTYLMGNGKKLVDVYKLKVLGNLYERRKRADYGWENIVEPELKASMDDLDTYINPTIGQMNYGTHIMKFKHQYIDKNMLHPVNQTSA